MPCAMVGSSSRFQRCHTSCAGKSTRPATYRMSTCWRGELPLTMTAVDRTHLLTAPQMARFVTDGYLLLDAFVPDELNRRVYADQEAGRGKWHESEAIHEVFEWAPVKGILQSLVGE